MYSWSGSTWNKLGQDIGGEAAGDKSGYSVSLSADGGTVAIGAMGNDANGFSSGHVRVYSWSGSTWNKLGQDIDGEAAGDNSGSSVSLSADGGTVAIGATGNDGNGGTPGDDGFSMSAPGHVRVYRWSGSTSTWKQLGEDIDGEAACDNSGMSVSLSADGSTVAIGASGNNDNGDSSGHVRVYSWNLSGWEQLGQDIDGEAAYINSGSSVSLSADGSTVAIGAPYNDVNGVNSGHVRIFS